MMSLGIAELFQRMWKMHSGENFADKATDPLYKNLSNVMVVMWNMTDKCTALCEHSLDVGVHKDALKYMNAINPEETNIFRYAELQTNQINGIMNVDNNGNGNNTYCIFLCAAESVQCQIELNGQMGVFLCGWLALPLSVTLRYRRQLRVLQK